MAVLRFVQMPVPVQVLAPGGGDAQAAAGALGRTV